MARSMAHPTACTKSTADPRVTKKVRWTANSTARWTASVTAHRTVHVKVCLMTTANLTDGLMARGTTGRALRYSSVRHCTAVPPVRILHLPSGTKWPQVRSRSSGNMPLAGTAGWSVGCSTTDPCWACPILPRGGQRRRWQRPPQVVGAWLFPSCQAKDEW